MYVVCMCIYLHVWEYICIWVQMHMCAHAYGAQRLVPDVFLGCSPPYTLSCGKQQLVNPVSLASLLQRSLVSAFQVLGLHPDHHIHLAFMWVLGIQTLFLTSVYFYSLSYQFVVLCWIA